MKLASITGVLSLLAAPSAAQVTDSDDQAGDEWAPSAEEIIVTGRAQQLYRVDETVTGKLPTEPLDSSQVITTITEQLIEDQGARDAQDLYRNIAGVSFFSYAGVTARGFRQEEIFYDGLRGDPYAGFSVPQLFNIVRVEFLKGPAGMLYGPGAPGGLFNYITKKPDTRDFSGELKVIVGTEDRYGASAEVNAPLGGGFAARGGLFYEDRGLFRFNAASRTFIADGGVTYDPGPLRIIFQATRYDQELDANRLRGVPVDDEGEFLTSRRWNHNEPSDFLNLRSDVLQARIEGELLAGVSFDASIRYNDAVEQQQYHEPRQLFDADRDGRIDSVTRQFRDQLRDEQSWSMGANAIWSADLGSFSNRLLAGFDHFTSDALFFDRRSNGTQVAAPGRPLPLSLFNPAYGASDSSTYDLPPLEQSFATVERTGFYLLDEVTLGRLILVGGVRYDTYSDRDFGDGFDERFSSDAWTYRAGAVYRLREDLSLFGQYSTGFEPQSVFDQDPRAGGPFNPTTGRSFEGGIKTALLNGRVQSTLTAYHIKRRNILQADPRGDVAGDGIDDLVSVGEVTSEGIEFDIATDLTPNWVLIGSYAYNDARITEESPTGGIINAVGTRFANAPEHQLGFWTRYQIPQVGLAVALGGDYVSERRSLSDQRVDPYLVFDASLIYQVGPIRALLRVDNLFDKTYAASGFTRTTGHFPGEPRSVFVEVGYAF